MATAKIEIKNGKITNHNGTYFLSASEDGTEISINGWDVCIGGEKIICHTERRYRDGKHMYHREFLLQDGTIGLAGGHVDDRYAYFRTETFQAFLKKYGITAVKKEDPNQFFSGLSIYNAGGTANFAVLTDGEVSGGYTELASYKNNNLWCNREERKISKATWVIVSANVDYRDKHNHAVILYTLARDVTSLAASLDTHLLKA